MIWTPRSAFRAPRSLSLTGRARDRRGFLGLCCCDPTECGQHCESGTLPQFTVVIEGMAEGNCCCCEPWFDAHPIRFSAWSSGTHDGQFSCYAVGGPCTWSGVGGNAPCRTPTNFMLRVLRDKDTGDHILRGHLVEPNGQVGANAWPPTKIYHTWETNYGHEPPDCSVFVGERLEWLEAPEALPEDPRVCDFAGSGMKFTALTGGSTEACPTTASPCDPYRYDRPDYWDVDLTAIAFTDSTAWCACCDLLTGLFVLASGGPFVGLGCQWNYHLNLPDGPGDAIQPGGCHTAIDVTLVPLGSATFPTPRWLMLDVLIGHWGNLAGACYASVGYRFARYFHELPVTPPSPECWALEQDHVMVLTMPDPPHGGCPGGGGCGAPCIGAWPPAINVRPFKVGCP